MSSPDWRTVTLGEVTESFNRLRVPVKESDRRPGPYPYYGASGVVDHVEGYLFDGEYLLVSEDGENLQSRKTPVAFIATGKFWVNNHAHILRGTAGAATRFLCYQLENSDISGFLTGSAQPKLTKDNLGRIAVLLPPRSEQDAIVEVLGSLEAKIDLNRRANHVLEAIGSALFRSWFVDFEPVIARREGRPPAGMDAEAASFFPAHFQESEIGPVPEGWRVCGLDQVANFLNGLALRKYPARDGDFLPVVKIAELRTEDTSAAERASATLPSEYVIDDGDVIFSWSGSLLAIIWCGGKGALNQHLFRVTSDAYPKWFYYYWIQEHMEEFRDIAADKATTMGHIRRRHLSDAKVVVPTKAALAAADRMLTPLLDLLVKNKLENRALAGLRDRLLPGLLSGEVRLHDIEKTTGKSV